MAPAPELVQSVPVDLDDGRRVRVLVYDDLSIRFRISGVKSAYAMTECFLAFNPANAHPERGGHAILKVIPLPD
jgi:hypothetical protein